MSLFSEGKMRFKGYDITHSRGGLVIFKKDGLVVSHLHRYTPYDNEIKRHCDWLEGDIVPKSRRLQDVVRFDGTICKGETRY